MKKKFSIFFFISVIVISIFFVGKGKKSAADECNDCDPVPTSPGESDYCHMLPILRLDPKNPVEIEAGSSVVIKVKDGSAPFIWEDPGNGYSWASGEVIDADNLKRRKTNERSNTLQCTTGTCGSSFDIVASVTVTDKCGVISKAEIRNARGSWHSLIASGRNQTGTAGPLFTKTEGKYYWTVRLYSSMASNAPNSCSCTASSCSPYMVISSYGDQTKNQSAWEEGVSYSGFGTVVCCDTPSYMYAHPTWSPCSSSSNGVGWDYRIYEWSCP